MFRIIKNMLIVLSASIVNASTYKKRVSLSNQKCQIQSTLISLRPVVSCNTLKILIYYCMWSK